MQEENIQLFTNDELGSVRVIYNKDGSISFNAEDMAKGFGFIKIDRKNDKEYIRVDYPRVNKYISEFGNSFPKVTKDDYVPESLFYLLGMKANNETAINFQKWLAIDVIPSIRKHGAFIADSENVDDNYVLNELRFSQKRTIKTFANSDVNNIKQLYAEFKEYVDNEYKYKTSDRVARYKSVEKGLQQLHDNLAANPDNVGDCYNVRKLKEEVILDRTTLEKRISGGVKASQSRRISELEDIIDSYECEEDCEVEE